MNASTTTDAANVYDDFDMDIASPYTPEQLAELQSDTQRYITAARKTGDAITSRDLMLTRAANAGTEDVISYIMDTAGSVDEAERMAVSAGYGAHTWNDGEAITRRHKQREKAAKRGAKMTQLQNTEKRGAAPAIPVSVLDAQRAAMDYYGELMAEYPAAREKLARSLAWQISEYDGTLARYTGKGFSLERAAEFWLKSAKMAADKKAAQ